MLMRRMTRVAMMTAIMTAMTAIPARAFQAQVEPVAANPQVKDDLFAGTEKFAQGASKVTEVNLSPDMLGMVSGKQGGDLAHKMSFVVVHSYTYPKPGMYKIEEVEPYRQKLRKDNWNCFIHSYESKTGNSADVCHRSTSDHEGNEMAILTVEPTELTFIHISGNVSLADLAKLGALGSTGAQTPQLTHR